jgi:pre-mRNA-processing factor 19
VSSFITTITSEQLYPDTKSLALDASGDLVLVGGSDGIAGTYSIARQQLSKVLKATDGAINDVAWAGSRPATASSSGVVRLWSEEGTDSNAFTAHAGAATSLAVHPSGSILASVGADKSWVLYDLDAIKPITQVYNQSSIYPVHPAQFLRYPC